MLTPEDRKNIPQCNITPSVGCIHSHLCLMPINALLLQCKGRMKGSAVEWIHDRKNCSLYLTWQLAPF